MDMFPTVLASIGCKIEGERLGLGTNLFSNKETLFEELGSEYVNDVFRQKSTFYENVFG
jgi:phosphoglycerol transferase